MQSPAGSQRRYSSANYYLLGVVIETITGQTFDVVMRDKILRPLKLIDTGVYQSGQLVRELARNYKPVDGAFSFCPKVDGNYCHGDNINLALFTASGSMHSTVKDLNIWSKSLDDKSFLAEASKAYLFNIESPAAGICGQLYCRTQPK